MSYRKYLVGAFLALLAAQTEAQSVSLHDVLSQVEKNNRSLLVKKQENVATLNTYKTENNLPETSLDYIYQWGSRSELGHATEMNVIQEFDFPTLYAQRSKYNRLRGVVLDAEATEVLNEVLLQTALTCVEEVYSYKLIQRLQEEEAIMTQLVQLYEVQLQKGEATATEVNKLRLELQQFKQDLVKEWLRLNDLHYQLRTLNGGRNFENHADNSPLLTQYPALEIPTRAELKTQYIEQDAKVRTAQANVKADRKGLTVAKQGILPRLGAGFRRTTTSELDAPTDAYNGVAVTAALPIFSQRGKVKAARATLQTSEWELEQARLDAEQEFDGLYDKYTILTSMFEDQGTTHNISDLMSASETQLEISLKAGEISLIEYLTTKHDLFNHLQSVMEKEFELQTTKIQLMKNRLSQL